MVEIKHIECRCGTCCMKRQGRIIAKLNLPVSDSAKSNILTHKELRSRIFDGKLFPPNKSDFPVTVYNSDTGEYGFIQHHAMGHDSDDNVLLFTAKIPENHVDE